MIHLGDITKISGYDAPVVDVIIGGSPCQDLSVAGKRAGLAGERSGLYMEQIRIVKEMREADVLRGRTAEFIRPRYMVWENVPGAFSSNGGKDFAAVIEEIIKICEPDADVQVCVPDKGWTKSGCYYSDDGRWSIAWRVHDAQFWGVPQRRKRIALVADFGGLSAPEILFERKGVHWNSEPGRKARQATAGYAAEGADSTVYCLQGNGIDRAETAGCNGKGWREDVCYTLNTIDRPAVMGFAYRAGAKAGSVAAEEEMGPTLLAGRNDAAVYDARGNGDGLIAPCMTGDHNNRVTDYSCILLDDQGGKQINVRDDGTVPTIRAEAHGNIPCVLEETVCTDVGFFNSFQERSPTLLARGYKDPHLVHEPNHIVRRLTPLECERLQGYPDGWTLIGEPKEVTIKDYMTIQIPGRDCKYKDEAEAFDAWAETTEYDEDGNPIVEFDLKNFGFVDQKVLIGEHKEIQYFYKDEKGKKKRCADSQRYKALGNSIALPFWKVLVKRISAMYDRDATMASLFDGIGGFPLIWEQINGKGSCLWASEIEEFPMAVTKVRFK